MRAILIFVFLLLPSALVAEDRLVRLHAGAALVESGLMKHILPRFKLKTQVRVELVGDPASANMRIGSQGRALFEGAGQLWQMELRTPDHPGTQRLAKWLTSEVGLRTITGFAPDGTALFQPPSAIEETSEVVSFEGNVRLGHELARVNCGRCHAVDAAGRLNDIGSTPSFAVLRGLGDWEARFAAFFTLRPHGAFTQVEDVTEPFPIDRPSPIVPIELTLDELDHMLAYVAAIEAADLGQPLVHQ